jgi:archaemetzincin
MTTERSRWLFALLVLLVPVGAIASSCHCGGREAQPIAVTPLGSIERKLVAVADSAAPAHDAESATRLKGVMKRLEPLHTRPVAPRPGDWLAEHDEPGQSFDDYLAAKPVVPDAPGGQRRTLYVQPLGALSTKERTIVELSADYLERVFGLPVTMAQELPLSLVPPSARRVHPGEGWNFVFGQASLTDRVGVWSMHRHGDPSASQESFRLALMRTLKVAVHETGHMFSMRHCTAYECVMAGSNNLEESDRHPLWLCPECFAKLAWGSAPRSDRALPESARLLRAARPARRSRALPPLARSARVAPTARKGPQRERAGTSHTWPPRAPLPFMGTRRTAVRRLGSLTRRLDERPSAERA